eukprot:TRINITY_DN24150_c0_g1_i1.p1 TRINITY_DN24150_c0_g1~~TRINITY_DN24150_c0_g1_i1.p1  ORF type:complete len:237 (-),score=41.02 TRINITY_DN24150_c0_g1_i1:35-745(-)
MEPKAGSGESSLRNISVVVSALSNLVGSSFGPSGRAKLLITEAGVQRSRDSISILGGVNLDHPIAAIVTDTVRILRRTTGDGCCLMLLLAAELLTGVQKMAAEGIPPSAVCQRYTYAAELAMRSIDRQATSECTLREMCRALLSTKVDAYHADRLSGLLDEACAVVGTTEPLPIVLRLGRGENRVIRGIVLEGSRAVSYTHLTLPTKRIVEISVVAVSLKKKKYVKSVLRVGMIHQ